MTGKDYIHVKDLAHLISIIDAMRHICPQSSEIIIVEDYNEMLNTLEDWKDKHFEMIKITTP